VISVTDGTLGAMTRAGSLEIWSRRADGVPSRDASVEGGKCEGVPYPADWGSIISTPSGFKKALGHFSLKEHIIMIVTNCLEYGITVNNVSVLQYTPLSHPLRFGMCYVENSPLIRYLIPPII